MSAGRIIRLLETKRLGLSTPLPLDKRYDVIVVGAGVVGCAIARRFSQTGLAVAVIDRASDVGEGGASKSNSAIAHCGFDADPGSLESKLVTSASKRWPSLAEHLKIPFSPVGALMLARTDEDMTAIKKYYKRSLENGVDDVQLLTGEEARAMEPLAFEGEKLVGGLHIPRESVVDPFATCDAFAETALVQGGTDFYLQAEVDTVKQTGPEDVIVGCSTLNLTLKGKNVINSAGLGAEFISRMYKGESFTLNPRRGQFLVYDSLSRPLLNKILLPVPGPLGKGILITPTIFGNLLAGPTAEDMPMDQLAEATQTTLEGLEQVRTSVTRSLPKLKQFRPVAHYAGARSNCQQGSFLFRYGDGGNPNIVTLAGIRSTGLSTSFAVADEVFEQMEKRGMIKPKHGFRCEGRKRYPPWYKKSHPLSAGSSSTSTATAGTLTRRICFCESVDRDDIVEALRSPTCPPTTDGVKRRTRATTGRCQGFNCLVDVCRIISSEARMPVRTVSKRGPGTEWFPHYQDTLPPGYVKSPALKSSDLFHRMELYNHCASQAGSAPVTWNQDEAFQVAVIGAGPAGCGAIAGLRRSIHMDKLLLIERTDRIGGIPARYPSNDGKKTFVDWARFRMISGYTFAEDLRNELFTSPDAWKVHIKVNSTVMSIVKDGKAYRLITHDGHSFICDSVVFASGAREANPIERGCVSGHRASRAVFSNNLLVAGGTSAVLEGDSPVIAVGGGLVGRSILLNNNKSPVEFVSLPRDENPFLAKAYFGGVDSRDGCKEIRIWGPSGVVSDYELNGTESTRKKASAIVYSGNLVPNDEALLRSAFNPEDLPKRVFSLGNLRYARSPSSAWPGMACYLHAKHIASRQILKDFL